MPKVGDPILDRSRHTLLTTTAGQYAALITDLGATVVEGELAVAVIELLDEPILQSELIQRAVARGLASDEEVLAIVDRLKTRGLIRVVAEQLDASPAQMYRDWWKPVPARVGVRSTGEVPVYAVRAALWDIGLELSEDEDRDFDVAVVDDYLNSSLPELLDVRKATLLVQLAGPRPTIGPWLGAGGPCIECLQTRLRFNRSRDLALIGDEEFGSLTRGWTTATAHHGAAETAWEAHRYASGRRQIGARTEMTVIHHSSGERRQHAVVRRPQCPRCGESLSVDAPHWDVRISETPLRALADGSHRAMSAEETIERYRHLISSRTGVVEYLTDVDPSDNPVHVVDSGTNYATVRPGGSTLGFRQRAGGKGTTPAQARAGALAEAIERFSAVYTGEQPALRNSLADLGDAALDPRSIQMFSEHQYATRESLNSGTDAHQFVPEPFDPDQHVDFAPGWSLSSKERRWVPAALVYYGFASEHNIRWGTADSNGNASGTSMADAIEQGFYEIVERDAVALWWYNEARRPGIDLDSLEDVYGNTYPVQLREYYRRELDREISLLDVTSDVGVPAVVAVSRAGTGRPRVMLGFGSHHSPMVAANRALTELNQFLRMSHSLDKSAEKSNSTVAQWWRLDDLDDHAYLEPTHLISAEEMPVFDAFAPGADDRVDGREIVRACDTAAQSVGSELVVVNLTQLDVGMPVVKVIVPGLRHFWPRFAPGRLYDVPVELGWTDVTRTEETLNPTPIFW
ncbi:MAG TPA: TOMM precursor leader peptide-binding protein [Candidatus Nanopelagicales bacterium]|nr:TOMM precursor leader peptide-binding protein [Candidatus Nanopelagicales bacterium]